jgi:hypothetical protein
MNTVNLKSGNTLEIQPADFPIAWELSQACFREFGGSLAELGIDTKAKDVMNVDIDPAQLMGSILKLIASREIYKLLWPCFASCLYNGEKVTPHTFDPAKARADFLPCVIELFKVNVLPFIAGLDLSSITSTGLPSKGPK